VCVECLGCEFAAGSGSILAMVRSASQREPDIICGKPYKPMFDVLVTKYNIDPQKTLMIGDRSVFIYLYARNVFATYTLTQCMLFTYFLCQCTKEKRRFLRRPQDCCVGTCLES